MPSAKALPAAAASAMERGSARAIGVVDGTDHLLHRRVFDRDVFDAAQRQRSLHHDIDAADASIDLEHRQVRLAGAAFDAIEVTPLQLISGSRSLKGWVSGTPIDSEDTLRFCELTGVRPMVETYPLEKAEEAYQRMMSGKARFRVVLKASEQ